MTTEAFPSPASCCRPLLAWTDTHSRNTVPQDGTMLATASEKGTLIRVFDSQTGKKLCEVRRGSERAMVHWYAAAAAP